LNHGRGRKKRLIFLASIIQGNVPPQQSGLLTLSDVTPNISINSSFGTAGSMEQEMDHRVDLEVYDLITNCEAILHGMPTAR